MFCINMSDKTFLPDNAITKHERQEDEMILRKKQADLDYNRKVNNAIVAEKKAKREAQLQKIRDEQRNKHIKLVISVVYNALLIWVGYLIVINLLRWFIFLHFV